MVTSFVSRLFFKLYSSYATSGAGQLNRTLQRWRVTGDSFISSPCSAQRVCASKSATYICVCAYPTAPEAMARMGMTLSVSFVVLSKERKIWKSAKCCRRRHSLMCLATKQNSTKHQGDIRIQSHLCYFTVPAVPRSLEGLIVAKQPDFLLAAFVFYASHSICLYDVINVCLMEKCAWYKNTRGVTCSSK